jgi:putative transposase
MKFDPQKHHRRSIRLKGYDYAQPGAYFVTLVAWHREALFGEVVGGCVRLSALGRIVEEEWKRLPHHFPMICLDAFVVMPNHIHGIILITDTAMGATRTAPTDPIVRATHPLPSDTSANVIPLPNEPVDNHGGSPRRAPDGSATSPDGSRAPTDPIIRATHPLPPDTSANVIPLPNEPVDNHGGSPLPVPLGPMDIPDGSPLHAPNGPAPGSLGAIIGQFKSRATKRIWALPEYAHTPIWQRNYYEHIIRNEAEWGRICEYIQNNPLRWYEDQMHPTTPPKPFNQDKQHG